MLNITRVELSIIDPISVSENNTIDKVDSNSRFNEAKIRVKITSFKIKNLVKLFLPKSNRLQRTLN